MTPKYHLSSTPNNRSGNRHPEIGKLTVSCDCAADRSKTRRCDEELGRKWHATTLSRAPVSPHNTPHNTPHNSPHTLASQRKAQSSHVVDVAGTPAEQCRTVSQGGFPEGRRILRLCPRAEDRSQTGRLIQTRTLVSDDRVTGSERSCIAAQRVLVMFVRAVVQSHDTMATCRLPGAG